MTAPISIQVDDRELRAALNRLTRLISNPSEPMEDIARALGNHAEDSFQSQSSPFGDGWEDLKDATKKRRAKDGHWPGPILQISGGSGLAGSITHGSDRDSAWVAVSKEYAAIHQFGGKSGMAPGPAAIPARPYLPVNEAGNLPADVFNEVLEIISDAIQRVT